MNLFDTPISVFKERFIASQGRKLVAIGAAVGLVGSMGIGALTRSPSIEDFISNAETITEADLSAGVLEGSATTDRDNAVAVLMGQGMSKDEARAYADGLMALESGVSAKDEIAANKDAKGGDDNKGVGGAAGLSKSAGVSSLLALSPAIRGASSGDGNQITSVNARWISEDDQDNNNPDVLYLAPQQDSIRDLVLQLDYALAGENDYAPGDVRITVPAQIFKDRDGKMAGTLLIPYPETPKKSQDFNWERIGDNYVLTNTRTLNAATKGFIQFGLVDNPAAHEIIDMSTSNPWQANVEVITKVGNTLSLGSNALQVQVNTFQNLTAVTKTRLGGSSSSLVPASEIPEAQRIAGETEYVVKDWVVSVSHNGNQPFRIDLKDEINSDYDGFVLDVSSDDNLTLANGGRTLQGTIFEGWTAQSPLQFTVRTAYPASKMPECGRDYEVRNKATVTLTPLDGIDSGRTLESEQSAVYNRPCPVPTTIGVNGGYDLCKQGNNGVDKGYSHKHGTGLNNCNGQSDPYRLGGEYLTALNQLRDGKSVEIDYDMRTRGVLLPQIFNGAEGENARYVLDNYINNPKPVTLVTTDTGTQLLNESGVKAGTDWEFTYVNIPKPSIGKPESYGLNPDGTPINKYDDVAGIRTTNDDDDSHIPAITVEAKVGASWQKVADVDYSSGSCQVTYADKTTSTDCAHIALPEKTTQFRTSVTSTNGLIEYTVYPHMVLHNTQAMRQMAQRSFDNTYTPLRYMRNSSSLVVTDSQDKQVVAVNDRWALNELRGFTADTQVHAEKSARNTMSDANYELRCTTIHYTAQVREETFISSQGLWDDLVAIGEITPTTSGVWYDLLPRGVYPVLDTVTLRHGDSIKSVRVLDNYKGTGRALMIVEADLTPQLKYYTLANDTTHYLRDVPTISFDARIDFDSIVDYGDVLHNVIAFEAGKDKFGTIPQHMGEPDNPSAGNNVQSAQAFKDDAERTAMTNLNPNNNNPSFVYAGREHSLAFLASGRTSLEKAVMVNNDGIWQKGTWGADADVYAGGIYAYRLRMMSDTDTISKDLVLYDSLESFAPTAENDPSDVGVPQWQGTFQSIDVSQMRAAGAAPKIYYSTSAVPLTLVGDAGNKHVEPSISDTSYWHEYDEANPPDPATVRAIAVDVRHKADGSDFELQPLESVTALVRMKAPSGANATAYANQGAHAFNNAFLDATSIDVNVGVGAPNAVRNDYTKVGVLSLQLQVTKTWDDDNNRDGLRPSSVTARLYRNGSPTDRTVTLSEANGWKDSFRDLDYVDEHGDPIAYSIAEEGVPAGYTSRVAITGEQSALIRNVHEPEKISLSGTKTWVDAVGAPIPESITVVLYGNGKKMETKTVTPDENGEWTYEFTDLYKNENGQPITYTIGEQSLGEGWLSTVDGMNLTNTWHPYGDVVLSKTIEGGTNVTRNLDFSFRLSLLDKDGNPLVDAYEYETSDGRTGTVRHNGVMTLRDTQTLRIKKLPMGAVVQAEESERAGFTVKDGALKEVTVKANTDGELAFTNVYKTSGAINLEASKTLTGQDLRRGQFIFEVYEGTPDNLGNLLRAAGNAADGTVTFGAFRYANADAGKTYTYTIKEKNTGLPGVTYSEAVYQARVSVADNGDGTMSTSVTYEPVSGGGQLTGGKPNFANAYHASGEAALKAWKTLKYGTLAANQFSFDLFDANGTHLQTKTNTADGAVDFDPLQFNETHAGQTFLYVIREQAGTDANVTYDTASVFGYQLEVVDQRDGTLGFNLTKVKVKPQGSGWVADGETEDDAVFKNEMKPGALSVEKHTTDGSRDDLFHFKVKLTGEDVPENGSYDYSLSAVESLPVNNVVLDEYEVTDGTFEFCDGAQCWGHSMPIPSDPEIFPSNAELVSGTLTSPSGTTYDCVDYHGNSTTDELLCRIPRGDWGKTGLQSVDFRRDRFTLNASYNFGAEHMEPGLWVLDFQATDGEKMGFGSVSYLKYDPSKCERDSGHYVCNSAVSATSGNPATLTSTKSSGESPVIASVPSPSSRGASNASDEAISDDLKVVLASSRESVNNSLVSTRSGASEQARLLETVATAWSQGAKRPNTLNIKSADDPEVEAYGEFGGVSVTLYTDGTLEIPDGSTLTTPSGDLWRQGAWWNGIDCTKITTIKGKNIVLPSNSQYILANCTSLNDISALSSWDTSNVTNMKGMFAHSSGLTNLNALTDWDTSNVTDMSLMFSDCRYLANLDGLTKWNTTNVVDMRSMFSWCWALENVDALKTKQVTVGDTSYVAWDTSNVRDMSAMFSWCRSLTNLDGLTKWNISGLAAGTNYLKEMFKECTSLENVDALKTKEVTVGDTSYVAWDTSNVRDMSSVFENCEALANLDGLAEWNTSSVRGMTKLFSDCSALSDVSALGGWTTSSVTNMASMFSGCKKLSDVSALRGWNTSNVTRLESIFYNCTDLGVVDISGWNMGSVNQYNALKFEGTKIHTLTVGPDSRISQYSPFGNYTSLAQYQWHNADTNLTLSANDMVEMINSGLGEGTWERVYTVAFDAGEGATGTKSPEEVKVASDYTIPDVGDFRRFGYDFAGWNGSDGNVYQAGNKIEAGTITTPTLTLTAQWTQRSTSYTVQDGEFEFSLRGGEKATFGGIPAGTAYEVYEYTQKGWVLVQSSNTSGTIPANGTASASFTNRPINGVTTVQLEATKLLDGVGAEADKFSFSLTDNAGHSQTGVKNQAGGAIQFKQIIIYDPNVIDPSQVNTKIPASLRDNAFAVYRADQLPTLTITETGTYAGITTDSRPVTVTLNNPFNLAQNQKAVEYSRTPVFENTTQPATLRVTKNVSGAPVGDASEFSVQIALSEGSVPLADTSGITAKIGSANVALTWSSGVTTVKLRGGQTIELSGIPAGVSYAVSETDIPKGWEQTGSSGATGTLRAGSVANASVTNAYGSSGKLNLEAYKSLAGRELLEGEFEFELVTGANADGTGGTVIATAKNLSPDIRDMIPSDDTGTNWVANPHKNHALVAFDDLEITQAGTYKYTIRERAGSDRSVTYDTDPVTATVVATDNKDGTLSFNVTYSGGAGADGNLFENTVKTHNIAVHKTIENSDRVSAGYEDAVFLMKLSLSGDTDWASKNYALSYSAGSAGGSYRPSVWNATTTSGDTATTVNEITVGVRAGETVTVEGLYAGTQYSVEEIGWALGSTEYKLGESFSYVSGNATGAVTDSNATVTVTNRYDEQTPPSAQTTVTIEAQKNAVGATLKGNDFTFELLDSNGDRVATATNNAAGVVRFENIGNFVEADAGRTFIYNIREVVPEGGTGAWSYDTHEETVHVTVAKNGTDLVATPSYDTDGAEFTNEYAPVGYLALRADKEVTGDLGTLGYDPLVNNPNPFEFTLYNMANPGVALETVRAESDGAIYFSTITYGAGDVGKTYRYKIVEKVPVSTPAGWTYDTHEEYVSVTVTDTGGALLAVDTTYYAPENASAFGAGFTADPNDDSAGFAQFTNSYKFDPNPTGLDLSNSAAAALMMVLFAALAGVGYVAAGRSRR